MLANNHINLKNELSNNWLLPLNLANLKKKDVYPLAPDSKLKLNVISHTFNLKSVVFGRKPWFLIENCSF